MARRQSVVCKRPNNFYTFIGGWKTILTNLLNALTAKGNETRLVVGPVRMVNRLARAMFRALALAPILLASCHSPRTFASLGADASGLVQLSLRVPAALMIERGIDTLSVAVDPATLGLTQVAADAGMVLGVETQTRVFPKGRMQEALERHAVGRGADLAAGATTWIAKKDGIPEPGTEYVVEMQIVLFETDVPASNTWDPHAGNFKSLWTRTLRQAEE